MKHEVTVELAGGKRLSFETGHWAKQAHGSAVARSGENVVLGTACANTEPREGIDFFPLTVDYREYTYAGGRFPGGFIKREGRPSEREILTSRMIDRPLRPLFPETFRNETQVIALVLSADSSNDPDVLGINAAACALAVSDIPFDHTVGAVRVGQIDGQFIINPTYEQVANGTLNIMVVGTPQGIVMIEAGAREATEDVVVDAIEFGHAEIKKICSAIQHLASLVGNKKREVPALEFDDRYYNDLKSRAGARLLDALDTSKHGKIESYGLVDALQKELTDAIPEDDEDARAKLGKYYEVLRERLFREQRRVIGVAQTGDDCNFFARLIRLHARAPPAEELYIFEKQVVLPGKLLEDFMIGVLNANAGPRRFRLVAADAFELQR